MAHLISQPVVLAAHGSPPKQIEEYLGRLATGSGAISIARMQSPAGWSEPGQTARFAESTLVRRGTLRVQTRSAAYDVHAGQAIHVPAGEWVRYASPEEAEYVAVCQPAFSPDAIVRDPPTTPAEPVVTHTSLPPTPTGAISPPGP